MDNQQKNIPKKITAYVNTFRIHWLVEELQSNGIEEIMVTEFFRPNSQISNFEFLCGDEEVDNVKSIIHKIGTRGLSGDHFISVKEADTKSIFPFVQ